MITEHPMFPSVVMLDTLYHKYGLKKESLPLSAGCFKGWMDGWMDEHSERMYQ